MQIMTLDEFVKTPNNVLFCVCRRKDLEDRQDIDPGCFEGPFLKTGKYSKNYGRNGWNGAIDLFGYNYIVDDKRIASNWCSWDNSDSDYDDNDLFIVFEKKEIQQMTKILLIAMGSEEFEFPDDRNWYVDEREITEKEIFEHVGVTDEKDYDRGVCDENIHKLLCDYLISSK